nr:hypothetical protein [Candidatus Sigynarchaeota archaeon]
MLGNRSREYRKNPDQHLSIYPLGISIGVVIAPNTSPLCPVLDALDLLEGKAKARGKQEIIAEDVLFGGETWVALHSFNSIPHETEIDARYFENQDKIRFSSFPMKSSEMEELVKIVIGLHELNMKPNTIKKQIGTDFISSASGSDRCTSSLYEKVVNVKLKILYNAARHEDDRSGLKMLASEFVKKIGDHIVLKNEDFIDLLDMLGIDPAIVKHVKKMLGG